MLLAHWLKTLFPGRRQLKTRPSSHTRRRSQRGLWTEQRIGAQAESLEDRTLLSTITVTTNADEDDGDADPGNGSGTSLREAINAANAMGGEDLIIFDNGLAGQTITLGSALPAISEDVSVEGLGTPLLTISGNNSSRVLETQTGVALDLSAITITGGSASSGAGILNRGALTVTDAEIVGNTATTASGGGIRNLGTAATLTLRNSTLAGNSADRGGAIETSATSGSVLIVNSTISGNSASGNGGGINHEATATMTIVNSTITGNHGNIGSSGEGGGLAIGNANAAVLHNTIVAGNIGDSAVSDDIFGDVDPSSSNNLIGDVGSDGGLIDGTNGNIVGNGGTGTININTVLNTTLANNGGRTRTHALVSSSPAIDAGNNTEATNAGLTTDQTGLFSRTVSGTTDMGAVEFVITATEVEPNNSPATATPIAGFGTGAGDTSAAMINGSHGSLSLSGPFAIAAEPNDTFATAQDTLLTTGDLFVFTGGVIGDGPFGTAGSGDGDFDLFSVSATIGQEIFVQVDTSNAFAVGTATPGLDTIVGIYDSSGELLYHNDEFFFGFSSAGLNATDSSMHFVAPATDTFYVAVGGAVGTTSKLNPAFALPSDPTTGGTGVAGSTGDYNVTIGLDYGDQDFYSVELEAGDILNAGFNGNFSFVSLRAPDGSEILGSSIDGTGLAPDESPLKNFAGLQNGAIVAPVSGTYTVGLSGLAGPYELSLEAFRPVLEQQPVGTQQVLFLDFDGVTLDPSIFSGGPTGPATLSPLANFLTNWGLNAGDEDAVIDAILAEVVSVLQTDITNNGANPNFGIEILNSRDHADTFGTLDNASRVIIGGTIAELGIPTLGIAQSVDIGNFDLSETAVVLLDLLSGQINSGGGDDINALNGVNPGNIIAAIGKVVGNIASHEAGHFFGGAHTENTNDTSNTIDRGGNGITDNAGVGPDGIFGNGDDVTVVYSTDRHAIPELRTGVVDSRNTLAFGLSMGTVSADAVFNGTAGNDQITVTVVGSDLVIDNGGVQAVIPIAGITSGEVIINADTGDDTITVDASVLTAGLNVTVDGGAGDSDNFVFTDDGGTTTVTLLGPQAGAITANGQTISFSNIEPNTVTIAGTPDELILQLPNGLASPVVLENSTNSDETQLRSDAGTPEFPTVVFVNPAISLTIEGGNAGETIRVDSLDAAFDADVIINGNDGADTIDFNGTLAFGANDLTATAETIHQSMGSITVAPPGVVTLDAGTTGVITLTQANNDFATVALTAQNATLVDNTSIVLGMTNITNDLNVTAGGITQSATVIVSGDTILSAGSNAIDLDDPVANDFGTVSILSAAAATIRDDNTLDLGVSTITGQFDVRSAAAVTNSGPLVVGQINVFSDTSSVALDQPLNDFNVAQISLATTATIIDVNSIDLEQSVVNGDFSVTAGGAIGEVDPTTSVLDVGGNLLLSANGDIGTNAADGALDVQVEGTARLQASGSDIFITSNDDLEIDELATAANQTDVIDIRTTNGANLTLTGTNGYTNLDDGGDGGNDGDNVTLVAAGTLSIQTTIIEANAFDLTGNAISTAAAITSDSDISLTTNDLTIGAALAGPGNLTIVPQMAASSIGIGGGVGTLNIDDAELANLQDGFTLITIGDTATGSGTVTIDSSLLTDPVVIAGGRIDLIGELDAGANSVTLTTNAGGTQRITTPAGNAVGTDITASSVTFNGIVAPGGSPGLLNVNGDFNIGTGDTLEIEIDGTAGAGVNPSGHDQVIVIGNVDISGATLSTTGSDFGSATAGDVFTILDNDGTDAITGLFVDGGGATINNGDTVLVMGQTFRIFYDGGTGNDIVLAFAGNAPNIVYVDDDFTGANGTLIPDADPIQAGPQPAVIGIDAFDTIQEGVDAVAVGGTVLVNMGTYDEFVNIDKMLTLDGNAAAISDVVINPTFGEDALQITNNAADVTVRDLQLGGNTVTPIEDGLRILSSTGTLTFENLNIVNASARGFDVVDADNITITNLLVDASGMTGLSVIAGSGLQSLTIHGSDFTNNTGIGLDINDVSGAVTFTNVNATGNDRGVFAKEIGSFSDTDGRFTGNNDGGISLEDVAGDLTLVRTTLEDNDANNDGLGDGLRAEANTTVQAVGGNLLVQGVTARTTNPGTTHQMNGLFVDTVAGTVIFEDSTGVVVSNMFTANEADGVNIGTGTTATFTNGVYSNNLGNGLDLLNFSGTITLMNLTVNDNTLNGLQVGDSSDVTVSGGMFNGNDEDGIDFLSVGNVMLTNVTATGNMVDGVNLDFTDDVTITGGTFSNNGTVGLNLIDTLAVDVVGVTVDDNGQSGLLVEDATDVTVQGGSFTMHSVNGVSVLLADSLMVTTATITGNNTGLTAEDIALLTVTGSTITDNTADGISITNVGGGNVTNNFLNNNGTGVTVAGSGVPTISENDLSGNTTFLNNQTAMTLDASFNFFGLGINDDNTILAGKTGMVDFTPFFENGDADAMTSGFQGDFDVLNVTGLGEQFGAGRIQEAVDALNTGGTINVSGGTFTESVTIAKDLTLNGSGPTTVLDAVMANSITINDGATDLTLQNLRITNAATGISDNNSTTITTLNLSNIVIDGSTQGGSLNDVTNLNVTLTDNPETVNIDSTEFDATGVQTIAYANVAMFDLSGADGSDTFNVDPISSTNLTLNGNDPTSPATPGDTLLYNGPGTINSTAIGDGSITQMGFNTVNFTSMETVQTDTVTGVNGNFVIDAGDDANDGDADEFIVRLAVGGNIEVIVVDDLGGENIVFSQAPVAVNSITINGSDDDNTLTVDFVNGNPIPTNGITYNGNGNGTSDNDILVLENGTMLSVAHAFQNFHSGSVTVEPTVGSFSTISYTGLEPIFDNLSATDRIFTFAGTNDAITLSDDGTPADNISRIGSAGTSETVDFVNPTGSLTINAGAGDDTVTLLALDSTFDANATVNGGLGRDTFDLLATTGTTTTNLYTLNGNEHADTFNVEPTSDAGPDISINGDAPATTPGDTLNYNGIADVNGTGISTGTLDPAVATDQDITFATIELLNTVNQPEFTIGDPVPVAEGSAPAGTTAVMVEVTLSRGVVQPATVDVTTLNGSAIAGSDYNAITQTLTFNPGELTKMVTVLVRQDTLVELDESFFVTLSNASRATITDGTAEVSIVDDDVAEVNIADVSRTEGNAGSTNFVFTLSLTNPVDVPVSVTPATAFDVGATAADAGDFVANTQNVLFAPGQTTQTFVVQVNGDLVIEDDETFTVNLSNVVADGRDVTINDGAATGTIQNDDSAFSIMSTNTPAAEGDGGGVTAYTYDITRSGDTSAAASVQFVVTGSGLNVAEAADFQGGIFPTMTVNFAAGDAKESITINVLADAIVEADEGFTVTLQNPSGSALIANGSVNSTIINDDMATLTVSDVSLVETDAGTTSFVFNVMLDNAVEGGLNVLASTANGTATAGSDFNSVASTLTFSGTAGEQRIVTVGVLGDLDVEGDEDFTVGLSGLNLFTPGINPMAVMLGNAGTGTIENDDTDFDIMATTIPAVEGDGGGVTQYVYTVTRTGDIADAVSINFAVTGSGANVAEATDFVGGMLPSGMLNFAANDATEIITIEVVADSIVEADEGFTVTIGPPPGNAQINTPSVDTIIGNDDTAELTISSVTQDETDLGTTNFVFTVTLDNAVEDGLQVTAMTADGTAMAGSDYTATTQVLNFAWGMGEQQTVAVGVLGDLMIEPTETLTVGLSNQTPLGVNIDPGDIMLGSAGTGTIVNDDRSVSIAADASAAANEEDMGTTNFTFTVTRTGDLTRETVVNYVVVPSGTNPAEPTDFMGGAFPSGTVTFPANMMMVPSDTQTISIAVLGDNILEADEGFTVMLLPPIDNTQIGTGSADGLIQNDDMATLTITDVAQDETNTGVTNFNFTVTLDNTVEDGFTVEAMTVIAMGDNATPNEDFNSKTDVLAFVGNAGETQTFTVEVLGDLLLEPDETFTVELDNVVVRGPGVNDLLIDIDGIGSMATGTIVNDDIEIVITPANLVQAEGTGANTTFTYMVTRTGDTNNAASVQFSVAGSGANVAEASDFLNGVLPSGTVNFLPGETTAEIVITVVADSIVEADEGFTVSLANPTDNAQIIMGSATGTITNDDMTTLTVSNVSQDETDAGLTNFVFDVTLSNAVEDGFSVTAATADGTATAGVDYQALNTTLNFQGTPGEMLTFRVEVQGDLMVEPDETFLASLSNVIPVGVDVDPGDIGFAYTQLDGMTPASTATGLIQNDDRTVTIAPDMAPAVEGDMGMVTYTFTVTRDGDLSRLTEVDFEVVGSGVNPAEAADFVGGMFPSGTVTFAADAGNRDGTDTQTITIQVLSDTILEADEGFTVRLLPPADNTQILTATADGVIINDDSVSITIDAVPMMGIQDEGNIGEIDFAFTATLNGDVEGGLTVDAVLAAGMTNPATPFIDFVDETFTLEFDGMDGQQIPFDVRVLGDLMLEDNEEFVVSLTNLRDLAPGTDSIFVDITDTETGTIQNDDREVAISLVSSPADESDTANSFVFEVSRTGDLTRPTSINYVVVPSGTNPAEAADFVGGAFPSGTVMFPAVMGMSNNTDTPQTITIDVIDDAIVEANEGFTVMLLPPADNTQIATDTADAVIINDDMAEIMVEDISQVETDSGITNFVFTATLDADVEDGLTVDILTTAPMTDTAVANTDYNFKRRLLTFAGTAGEMQTFSVEVLGDLDIEPDEVFTVGFENLVPLGAGVSTASIDITDTATGTIENDDREVSIVLTTAPTVEGDTGTVTYTFTVTRTGDLTQESMIAFEVLPTGMNPAEADDFAQVDSMNPVFPSGMVMFPAGMDRNGTDTQTITIEVQGDSIVEADEGFTVSLTPVGMMDNTQIATATADAVIVNDDTASISITDVSAIEGDGSVTNFNFVITLTGDVEDGFALDARTIEATMGPLATFADDLAFNTQTLTFAGMDTESQIFQVQIAADDVVEADEVFEVLLENLSPTGAGLDPADVALPMMNALGTIQNDDTAALTVNNVSVLEGSAGAPTLVNFTVTLSQEVQGGLNLDFATMDGTAISTGGGLNDFSAEMGTLMFAGLVNEQQTIEVAIDADQIVEGDETFEVVFNNLVFNGMGIDTADVTTPENATGTIRNDDNTTISLDSVARNEADGTILLTLSLSSAVGEDTTFDITALGIGQVPADAMDFTLTTTSVMLPASDMVPDAPIVITLMDDNFVEFDEQVEITATVSGFGMEVDLGMFFENQSTTGIATIVNDDALTVSIRSSDLMQNPGDTMRVMETDTNTTELFAIELNDTVAGPLLNGPYEIEVVVVALPGTAVPDFDYSYVSEPIIFTMSDGVLITDSFEVLGNDIIEMTDEMFQFRIEEVRFGTAAQGRMTDPSRATIVQDTLDVIIEDDDTASLTVSNSSATEGDTLTFTVSLDSNIAAPVTVDFVTSDMTGTALSPEDFPETTGTLIFDELSEMPVNTPFTREIDIPIPTDIVPEMAEDFVLNLIQNSITFGGQPFDGRITAGSGTGTILDNPFPVLNFSQPTFSALEGNAGDNVTLDFTLTLSEPVAAPVEVQLQFVSQSALLNSDFGSLPNGNLVTIPANTTTFDVRVPIVSEGIVENDETFQVNILSATTIDPSNEAEDVVVGPMNSSVGTIENDDSAIISVSDVSVVEGSDGNNQQLVFAVTLNAPVEEGVTIDYEIAGLTATVTDDFTVTGGLTGTITFPGVDPTDTFNIIVTTVADMPTRNIMEANETLQLRLLRDTLDVPDAEDENISFEANGNPVPMGDIDVTGTIINDDTLLLTSPDVGGGPHVRGFDHLGNEIFSFLAYDANYFGGVRTAVGDVNGDGVPDIITAPGPGVDILSDPNLGMEPLIRIFDGASGTLDPTPLGEFLAYDPAFQSGVFLAVADVDNDGQNEIITGPEIFSGPIIRVFDPSEVIENGATGPQAMEEEFAAYPGAFFGGVRIATGDVTGDGVPDLITGPGFGGGPIVRVFDMLDATRPRNFEIEFFAFPPEFTNGVFVAVADFNANPNDPNDRADIVVSMDMNDSASFVLIFDVIEQNGNLVAQRPNAFGLEPFPGFQGGVRVATTQRVGDNTPDLVVAAGKTGGPFVRIYDGDSLFDATGTFQDTAAFDTEFAAYSSGFTGGVFVSGTLLSLPEGSPLQLATSAISTGEFAPLTASDLAAVSEAAISRFQDAGLSTEDALRLANTPIIVQDLSSGLLGLALDGAILIDVDASGAGWFIDPTPTLDEEFSATAGGLTASTPEALGRVDLLTVILHEFGHLLGFDDLPTEEGPALMSESLAPNLRRLPEDDTLDELFANGDLLDSLLLDSE